MADNPGDNIQVCVRVRPLVKEEQNKEGEEVCWNFTDNSLSHQTHKWMPPYQFDHLFKPTDTNENIFEDVVKRVVGSAMNGFHGSVFSYGQTGSGKTFTMNGGQQQPGIIPQAIYECFDLVHSFPDREFLLRVSYFEVYNEQIKDLLSTNPVPIKIQHDPKLGTVISGHKEQVVLNPEQVIALIRAGEAQRHVGSTDMNEKSSRAHTIFRLVIESKELHASTAAAGKTRGGRSTPVKVSTLNLIDLAGSESAKMTNSKGIRAQEAKFINQSLLTLSTIIQRLSENSATQQLGRKAKHLPYRDSKLTRLLESGLDGSAFICVICTISPSTKCSDETVNTLKFASRAKLIKTQAKVNEVVDDKTLLKAYREEIEQLRAKLEAFEKDKLLNTPPPPNPLAGGRTKKRNTAATANEEEEEEEEEDEDEDDEYSDSSSDYSADDRVAQIDELGNEVHKPFTTGDDDLLELGGSIRKSPGKPQNGGGMMVRSDSWDKNHKSEIASSESNLRKKMAEKKAQKREMQKQKAKANEKAEDQEYILQMIAEMERLILKADKSKAVSGGASGGGGGGSGGGGRTTPSTLSGRGGGRSPDLLRRTNSTEGLITGRDGDESHPLIVTRTASSEGIAVLSSRQRRAGAGAGASVDDGASSPELSGTEDDDDANDSVNGSSIIAEARSKSVNGKQSLSPAARSAARTDDVSAVSSAAAATPAKLNAFGNPIGGPSSAKRSSGIQAPNNSAKTPIQSTITPNTAKNTSIGVGSSVKNSSLKKPSIADRYLSNVQQENSSSKTTPKSATIPVSSSSKIGSRVPLGNNTTTTSSSSSSSSKNNISKSNNNISAANINSKDSLSLKGSTTSSSHKTSNSLKDALTAEPVIGKRAGKTSPTVREGGMAVSTSGAYAEDDNDKDEGKEEEDEEEEEKEEQEEEVLSGVSQMLAVLKSHISQAKKKRSRTDSATSDPETTTSATSSQNNHSHSHNHNHSNNSTTAEVHVLSLDAQHSTGTIAVHSTPGSPTSSGPSPTTDLDSAARSTKNQQQQQLLLQSHHAAVIDRLKLDLRLKEADNRFLQDELAEKDQMLGLLTEGLKEVEVAQTEWLKTNQELSAELERQQAENKLLKHEINKLKMYVEQHSGDPVVLTAAAVAGSSAVESHE